MKNIVDFILESKGQRISMRAGNRPYDPNKDDKLLKNRDSRPGRAQELRETKLDKQVQEFCTSLVYDFMVKFYNLTINKPRLLSFGDRLTRVFNRLAKDNDLNDIKPEIDRIAGGCVFLYTDVHNNDYDTAHTSYVLQYETSDTFANILKNLNFYNKVYRIMGNGEEDISGEGKNLYIGYNKKFFASVLHRLRKHDLAKKVEDGRYQIDVFELLDDVADNYNKNYFADKFKEIETAYNEVLAKW
jgi:hypothetical protein